MRRSPASRQAPLVRAETSKMLKKSTKSLPLMVIVALLAGCADMEDMDADLRLTEQEIITNLLIEAGYPEEDIEVLEDGRVVVGSDAVVTLAAAREMADRTNDFVDHDDDEFRQYRTTNVVNTLVVDTICIVPTAEFNANAAASSALDLAIQRYNALGLQFSMVRNGANCDATIAAKLDNSGGGVSGFPAGGMPYHEFYIGQSVASNYGVQVGAHVIEHELGHCIGFRHTDYYDRSISCGGAKTNEGASIEGAVLIEGTPSTAVLNGSVMNACYNANSNGVWTNSDLVALGCLYDTGSCAPAPPPNYSIDVATFTNRSGARRSKTYYGPYDATAYQAMKFSTSGGTGDADVYVRLGAQPTLNAYDCVSAASGNTETCEANPAADGLYYVMVYGYTAYSGLTLRVQAN